MRIWRRTARVWAGQRGSGVAQAAAVALAAAVIIGALTLVAPRLGTQVDTSFRCLVGVLTGGGSGCTAAAAAPESAPPAPEAANKGQDPAPEQANEDCDIRCQALGFLKGFGDGIWDTITGFWSLGTDLVKLIAGDDETWAKYEALIQAFQDDPVGVARALLGEMAEPILEDWRAGRYGEATGRLLYEVISTIGGPKALDKLKHLGKLDDAGRVVRRLDDLADTARVLRDIPCVGSAPIGKAPGLAKPPADPCADIAATLAQRSRRAREELAALDPKLRRGGRNVASSRVEIEGRAPEELISVSGADPIPGTVPTPQNRVFDTFRDGIPRDWDTEVKILEEFARRNGAQRGGMYPDLRGRIDLYTERTPCGSCTGVIEQFRRMYPNVEINVYYGTGRDVQIWTPPVTR